MPPPSTKSDSLHLLFIAPGDEPVGRLVAALNAAALAPDWERVSAAPDLRAALAQNWDALLCVPGINGLAPSTAQKMVRELGLDIPFIVITPVNDEKLAMRAMKGGAHDVISLDELEQL